MENKILYLEIDEEITSVIDRLKKAEGTEIHLVVPKEAALLQSIVNLKLLKRQADSLGKQIQIITHDKVGRNLAEQVGIHSAARVGEAPVEPRTSGEKPEEEIRYKEKETPLEETKEIVFKKGALVDKDKKAAEKVEVKKSEDEEGTPEGKKKTSDFLPKFPHKKFILIAAGVFVALSLILYIYAPMTRINLKVAAEKQDMKADIIVDKGTKEVNSDQGKIPGTLVSAEKTITKKYQATGKKDIGTKAQGTITINNSYSTLSQTLVAGTRFEANGMIYKTQSDVDVPGYTDPGGGNIAPGSASVSAVADTAGDQYNVSSSSMHIPSFAGTAKYDKIIGSTNMSGGTSKKVTVVTATDIANSKKTFGEDAKNEINKEGTDKLQKGETLNDKAKKVDIGAMSVSKNPDDEADDFTISAKTTFAGLSYKDDDLNKVSYDMFKSKTASTKQILEDKLEGVNIAVNEIDLEKGTMSGESQATLHIGTKIDEKQLKTEISGDKEQSAKDYMEHLEGVDSVEINFWPGFYKRVARLKSHIYLKMEFTEKP